MSFPSTPLTKSHLDQGTDSPAAARTELAAVVDKINAILSSYATALGICDLDENGKVPVARFPQGVGSGTDADLLDGQHGAYYRNANNLNAGTVPAARFSDVSHGNRAGGSLHPAATQSVAGFMSAADKQYLDGVPAAIATGLGTIDTARVLEETAGATSGEVGTYIIAWNASTSNIARGSTIAGSSLRVATAVHSRDPFDAVWSIDTLFPTTIYAALSGTWRAMIYSKGRFTDNSDGTVRYWYPAFWLRIS